MTDVIVRLDEEGARLVQEKVAAGSYASADEVVREALLFFEQASKTQAEKLEWLRNAIRQAEEDGQSDPADEALDRLSAKHFGASSGA